MLNLTDQEVGIVQVRLIARSEVSTDLQKAGCSNTSSLHFVDWTELGLNSPILLCSVKTHFLLGENPFPMKLAGLQRFMYST